MASKSQADLLDTIEFHSLECLNSKPDKPASNAIKQGYREDDGLVLESDVDEQLLMYIPFNQVVKLHSLIVKGPKDSGPKVIKLYANRTSMGFSNVNDYPPTDTLTISADQLEGVVDALGHPFQRAGMGVGTLCAENPVGLQGTQALPLKYVKFQNVRSLTIFIESNQEEVDTTALSKIVILGSTVETTNMKDLKKVEQGHG